ncbi:hypothetical protein [Geomonas propionica]|uniref:Uncharacterized protein n=1 Tax=Geomonas propionica TaxID=2798582 RepID=A0ABS0YRM4_9BACT|nr:hypothetical protein [Geomonas propionica]MBJ6800152.1 hypothetical protein [Geomonas propionica]
MKRHGHQQIRHVNPAAELDRQHHGSIGGQHLAQQLVSTSHEGKPSNLQPVINEDFTPGRDPAEGPDVALTAPLHERWAQHTAERDPTEGSALTATPSGKVKR